MAEIVGRDEQIATLETLLDHTIGGRGGALVLRGEAGIVRLEPLSTADAGTLLDRSAPGLAPALRARVLDEAAGNPLGVVELGAAVARSGGSALLPSTLPLTTRVERTFGGLVADLPPLTRDLLLIAALHDGGSLDEIVAAATILTGVEVPTEAIQPAVTARLLSVDEWYELRFRHPLLRSALRQQAAPGDRRRVHAALAEVLSGSPERQLWHRASAVQGPDEALARELTEAAVGAAQRQAVAFALAAVNRAVQLSQDPAARGSRQIWACDLAHEQCDSQTVLRLLGEIDASRRRDRRCAGPVVAARAAAAPGGRDGPPQRAGPGGPGDGARRRRSPGRGAGGVRVDPATAVRHAQESHRALLPLSAFHQRAKPSQNGIV